MSWVGEPREFANHLLDQFVCDRYKKMARPHMCMLIFLDPLFFGFDRRLVFPVLCQLRQKGVAEIVLWRQRTRRSRGDSSLTAMSSDWRFLLVLVYLVVHPEHRRRGIGRQLINWGKLFIMTQEPPNPNLG